MESNDPCWDGLMAALAHEAIKLVAEGKDKEATDLCRKYLSKDQAPAVAEMVARVVKL